MSKVGHQTATLPHTAQMNTLRRMNASTPDEMNAQYQRYIQDERLTKTFKSYFDSEAGHEHVSSFFRNMLRMQNPETLEKFARYHTVDRINSFRDMFPSPADMCEIWNAWDRKGRPDIV